MQKGNDDVDPTVFPFLPSPNTHQAHAVLHAQHGVLQEEAAREGQDAAELQDVGANEKGVAESIQHGQIEEHAADKVWHSGRF